MELSKQVVSLELARKLKELGVKQESLFYYQMSYGNGEERSRLSYGKGAAPFDDNEYNISAFTASELGELIGKKVIETYKNAGKVIVMSYGLPNFTEDTEANARAKCLIYLIENKLITL